MGRYSPDIAREQIMAEYGRSRCVREMAAMIVLGVVFQQIIFIDVAIIYALLSFVGTLYIAKYLGGEL